MCGISARYVQELYVGTAAVAMLNHCLAPAALGIEEQGLPWGAVRERMAKRLR